MAHSIMPAGSPRRFTRVKASVFAIVLAFPFAVGLVAAYADHGVKCNGVFPGGTPSLIGVTASTLEAEPGGTVTHDITWTPNGRGDAALVDCFLVDYIVGAGSNTALDPIVEPMNTGYEGPNDGSETLTMTVPNDQSLIGHFIVARVRCTAGCQESKSDLIALAIVAPDVPDPSPSPSPSPSETPEPTPTPTPSQDPTPDPTPEPTPTDEPPVEEEEELPIIEVGGEQESQVLGTRKVASAAPKTTLPKKLAKTGPETTAIAWAGSIFLALGLAMRSGRGLTITPLRVAYAGQGGSIVPPGGAALGSSRTFVRFNGTIIGTSGWRRYRKRR